MTGQRLEKLLEFRRPSQYAGGEFLSIRKDWAGTAKKFLLASPAAYAMSASSLGGRIIYHVVNSRQDSLCERVFLPEADFRDYLLKNNRPLVSLENSRPAANFDIVGVTLSSRSSFLELSRIFKLLGLDLVGRGASAPIVMAGGPAVGNFAPLEKFFDAFLIGDAEEALPDALNLWERKDRRYEFLERLSKVPGFFVTGISEKTSKAVSPLKDEYHPRSPIVTNIKTLMNRLDVEVMRGCPNNCAFCESKRYYSPLRVRPAAEVKEIIISSVKNTGYGSVSLASLSSSQYPHLEEVVDGVLPFLRRKGVELEVPSLRPEMSSLRCVMKIMELNQPHLTFAPETFSTRMQEKINKKTDPEELFSIFSELKKAGLRSAKIYLMVGLPSETDADIEETIKVIKYLRKAGLNLTLGVSPFIPAPHTPFERERFCGIDVAGDRILKIKRGLRGVPVRTPGMESVLIEAALERGGIELSQVLSDLPDGEDTNLESWSAKMKDAGLDPYEYAMRDFTNLFLPWRRVSMSQEGEAL